MQNSKCRMQNCVISLILHYAFYILHMAADAAILFDFPLYKW